MTEEERLRREFDLCLRALLNRKADELIKELSEMINKAFANLVSAIARAGEAIQRFIEEAKEKKG